MQNRRPFDRHDIRMWAIKVKINYMTLKSCARACVSHRWDYCYRKKKPQKVCMYMLLLLYKIHFQYDYWQKTKRNNQLLVSRSLTRIDKSLFTYTNGSVRFCSTFVGFQFFHVFLTNPDIYGFTRQNILNLWVYEYIYWYKYIKQNIVFPVSKSSISFRFIN